MGPSRGTLQSLDNLHHTKGNRRRQDLRNGHAAEKRYSDLLRGFPAPCCLVAARASSPARVLIETCRRTKRRATKAHRQTKQRHCDAVRAGPAHLGSFARGKGPRSWPVLHEKRGFGRGHRPFPGRDRGQTRIRHPFSVLGRSAREKGPEKTSHQILPALSGFISARRRRLKNQKETRKT